MEQGIFFPGGLMRIALVVLELGVVAGMLAGCADLTSADGSMIAGVVVDETTYSPRAALDAAAESVGDEYMRVSRYVDCSEGVWQSSTSHVSDYCPLKDGESNYLPTGTPIYRIEGVDPGVALTVEYGGEWEVLRPIEYREAS